VVVITRRSLLGETVKRLEVLVKMAQRLRILVPALPAGGEAAGGIADLMLEFLSLKAHLERG